MKVKILDEVSGTDLLRIEINHQIQIIHKQDLERITNEMSKM